MWELGFHRASPVPRAALEGWLEARHHWRVASDGAVYDNPVTGVHAWMRLGGGGPVPATFLLPWARPHTFALEAAIEIAALVGHFGLEVRDPAPEGMGEGAWDRGAFLRGWGLGCAAACQALAWTEAPERPTHTLPAEDLAAVWRWNYDRLDYQDHLRRQGSPCFVPGVFFFGVPGDSTEVRTGILWSDAIPAALPDVDEVVITGALAPDGPKPVARASLADALEGSLRVLAGAPWDDGKGRRCTLGHTLVQRPGPDLVGALRSARAGRHLVRLPPDRVLTRELATSPRPR